MLGCTMILCWGLLWYSIGCQLKKLDTIWHQLTKVQNVDAGQMDGPTTSLVSGPLLPLDLLSIPILSLDLVDDLRPPKVSPFPLPLFSLLPPSAPPPPSTNGSFSSEARRISSCSFLSRSLQEQTNKHSHQLNTKEIDRSNYEGG